MTQTQEQVPETRLEQLTAVTLAKSSARVALQEQYAALQSELDGGKASLEATYREDPAAETVIERARLRDLREQLEDLEPRIAGAMAAEAQAAEQQGVEQKLHNSTQRREQAEALVARAKANDTALAALFEQFDELLTERWSQEQQRDVLLAAAEATGESRPALEIVRPDWSRFAQLTTSRRRHPYHLDY